MSIITFSEATGLHNVTIAETFCRTYRLLDDASWEGKLWIASIALKVFAYTGGLSPVLCPFAVLCLIFDRLAAGTLS